MKYGDAGVDVPGKSRILAGLRSRLESTHGPEVQGGIGGFAGVYRAPDGGGHLVATADGVGTKVLLARQLSRDRGVARDLVHHCVDDCICSGATPLFFLDYIAGGKLDGAVVGELLEGFASACGAHGIPILGGETAEMPGVYGDDAYDVAGFLVGHAAPGRLLDPARVRPGDGLIGLPSVGLHTNGYSLARKIVRDRGLDLSARYPGLAGTLGDALLAEHPSYAAAVRRLRDRFDLRSLAHITGGGLPDNLPRALPPGLRARLHPDRWSVPPILELLAREGDVPPDEARRVWNAGIGIVAILPPEEIDGALEQLRGEGHGGWGIGVVEEGEGGVVFA